MSALELKFFIGGDQGAEEGTFQDVNPAQPEEILADLRLADETVTSEAINAAWKTFREWRETVPPGQ